MELPRIKRKLSGPIDLRGVKPGEELGYAAVLGVQSQGPHDVIKKRNVRFINCSLSKQVFKGVSFHNCIFYNCVFNGASFLGCEFHDCVIVEGVLFKTSFDNTYIDPSSFIFDERRWLRNFANVNAWLYWELYKNCKNMHQEKFAMNADKKFGLYKRYEYFYGRKRDLWRFFKGWMFDWLLGSGYGVVNSAIVTVSMIGLFAWLASGSIVNAEPGVGGIINALYFSIVSFTTVGYGDYLPAKKELPLLLTALFLLLSVVWGAIVTAIIVKRIVK